MSEPERSAHDAGEAIGASGSGAEFFTDVLMQAPIGIHVVDQHLIIRQVNAMAAQWLGPANWVGRALTDLLQHRWPLSLTTDIVRSFRHTLATGEPCNDVQHSAVRRDRQQLEHYEWQLRRVLLPDGQPGVACYFRENSDRVRAREELQWQRDALHLEQRRLDFIQQATRIGLFDWDMVADTSEVTPQWRRIYGLPLDGPMPTHQDWLRCVHPEDRERAATTALAAAQSGDTYEREFRVVWPDGSIHWVLSGGKTLLDAHGNPHRLLGAAMDITARKRAEEQVVQNEQRFRVALMTAPLMIYTTDRELRCTWVHHPVLGVNAETIIGKRDEEIFPLPIVAPFIAIKRRVLESGRAERGHVSTVMDGKSYTFDVTIEPQREADGSVSGLIGAVMDITDLTQAKAAAEAADRRKDVFLATLAHELRNPLAPIRTAAQILGSPQLEPQQLQWAQGVIARQVRHMALLLDDLLDIARITQGKLELKKESVRLTDIVDSAIEAARPLIESKHHAFSVSLPPTELTLVCDPLRLAQVLSNLLTNAAKYTDPAGHIELCASVADGTLCVSVKDDGIGISAESLVHIFDMFSQIDEASSRAAGGLGIGLALVKGLVDLHGGHIEVSSDGLGRGSTFTVHLPVALSSAAADAAAVSDVTRSAADRRRVLVADDNKDAADSLAMLLKLEGHDVRVAHNGRAALSLAQTFRPHVALLDIGMPELSGYEVAVQMRREAWGAGIKLIAISGWGQDVDRQRASLAGFDQHLTKPIDPAALERLL
jgi:PAS domain S-box-containing protein